MRIIKRWQRYQVRKRSGKNGTNEFTHHGVATNVQFVKNQVSAKCNKLYHNKMRYACIVDLLENVLSVPQFICGIKTSSIVTRLCDSVYQLKSMISTLEMNRYTKRNHLKQLKMTSNSLSQSSGFGISQSIWCCQPHFYLHNIIISYVFLEHPLKYKINRNSKFQKLTFLLPKVGSWVSICVSGITHQVAYHEKSDAGEELDIMEARFLNGETCSTFLAPRDKAVPKPSILSSAESKSGPENVDF